MSRQFNLPLPESKAKPEYDYPTCDAIHEALRDIRKAGKQANATTAMLEVELQVLERIYYKYKNSHRPTVPWGKFVEMRRLGARVKEVGVAALLESIRTAFYSVQLDKSNKPKRTVWSQIPSAVFVEQGIRRMHAIKDLLSKCQEVCHKTYAAFSQYLDSTGYIQSTVTIMAITSRVRWLVAELDDARSLGLAALLQILKALNPDLHKKYHYLSRVDQPPQNSEPTLENEIGNAKGQSNAMDLGEPISRPPYIPTPLEVVGPPDQDNTGIMLLDEDDLDAEPPQPAVSTQGEMSKDAAPIPEAPTGLQKPLVSAKEDRLEQKPKKKSKKPKKRDEIDNIFGF